MWLLFSVLEQPAAGAQENRNQVDLQLVELARLQQCLRRTRAVHHHRAIAGCGAGLGGAFDDVGAELRSTGRLVAVVDVMGQHKDRYAAVMVALPAFGKLECPSSCDHGTCGHELAEHLAVGARAMPVIEPLEQPPSAVASSCPSRSSGPVTNQSRDMDM
jgi:hypothetical protein